MRSSLKFNITLSLLMAFMILGYSNCADIKSQKADSVGSSATDTSICDQALISAFETSYYRPILRDTALCARCHTESGASPIKFASSNLGNAYSAFMRVGADQVDINAVNPSHASGVTGPALQSRISAARTPWDQAYTQYQDCVAQLGPRVTAITTSNRNSTDLYFGTGRVVTFLWDLNSGDAEPASQRFPGVLAVDIQVNYETVDGELIATGYRMTNPRLRMLTGEQEVEVEGVTVKINGVDATGIEPFLSARNTFKGIDFRNLYTGSVNIRLSQVSSSDTFSLGLGYFDLRPRTDNPPIPATPNLTAPNPFIRQANFQVSVSNDSTARLWCLTTSSRVPRSTAEVCPGFEGSTVSGWVATRPTNFDFSSTGTLVTDGQSVDLYLWIANADLKMNSTAATTRVTFDSSAPVTPTFTSLALGNTQMADLVGLQDSNEVVGWCVKEGATTAAVNTNQNCSFATPKPTFVGLKGSGTRFVSVFTRDRAGNISAVSPIRTVDNPYGRITFQQLSDASYGERAVLYNRCNSCHGASGANRANWDSTSYANTVSRRTAILNRIADTARPNENLTGKDRALIELWFTQTATPVEL